MIIVTENDLNKAWKTSLKKLYLEGNKPQDERFFKIDTLVIELKSHKITKPDKLFPISEKDINIINNFIISGENEEQVCHEWTKLYYHRLFDGPNSQIEYIINRIQKDRVGIACNWIKDDQNSKIKPCMLSITASNENGKLNFQLHARACNIYNKLLMNLQEFVTVQQYIATQLNLTLGKFTMFIDYAQISKEDVINIENILQLL